MKLPGKSFMQNVKRDLLRMDLGKITLKKAAGML